MAILLNALATDYRRSNSEKSGKVLFGYKKNDKKEFLKPIFNDSVSNNQFIPDIKNIDAEFLINVIETSFKTINKPWNTHLSFEEFCEHILPYRLNTEPVFDMRKKLHNHYINHTNIDSLNKSTDKIIYHFNEFLSGCHLNRLLPQKLLRLFFFLSLRQMRGL